MKLLLIPVTVWLMVQLFKFFHRSWQQKRYSLNNFLDYGGMPSTHTVLIASFATEVGLQAGVWSPVFGFCLLFAAFIIHDALRLRNLIQGQSKLLNHLRLNLAPDEQTLYPVLSEHVGHTISEIIAGAVTGVALTLGLHFF